MNLRTPQDEDGEKEDKEDKEEEKKEEQSEDTRKRKSTLPAFDTVLHPAAAGDARIPITFLATHEMFHLVIPLGHQLLPIMVTCMEHVSRRR